VYEYLVYASLYLLLQSVLQAVHDAIAQQHDTYSEPAVDHAVAMYILIVRCRHPATSNRACGSIVDSGKLQFDL
jgi:hypothetical protein